MMKNCQFLLGVHLNDNNITKCKYNEEANDFDYEDLFYDITSEFFITEEDLIAIGKSKKPIIKGQEHVKVLQYHILNSQFRKVLDIDYYKYLQMYFNNTIPEQKLLEDATDYDQQTCRKIFKDHIFLGKEAKILHKYKKINQAFLHYGSDRTENTTNDSFVVTRKLNHPELIFN